MAQRDSLANVSSAWLAEHEFADALAKKYDLYISDSVSIDNETWFRDMADNCPYDDGMAVYLSREAVAYMDGFAVFHVNSCEYVPTPPSNRLAGAEEAGDINEASRFSELKIYPNPAKSEITIETPECLDENDLSRYHMQIFAVSGKMIMNQPLKWGVRTRIELGVFANGLYNVQIADHDGSVWNKKILVVK